MARPEGFQAEPGVDRGMVPLDPMAVEDPVAVEAPPVELRRVEADLVRADLPWTS